MIMTTIIDIKLLFKEEELHYKTSGGRTEILSFKEIATKANNQSPIVNLEKKESIFSIRFLDGGVWQI